MTTLTSGANGSTNSFDSDQLIGLSTATLGTHTSTTFSLTVDGITIVGQGAGLTYSGGHPSGGTLTSLSVDTNGTPAHWSDFSISVASLWQAIATGNVATFNSLFFGGNDTFDLQASQHFSGDYLNGGAGNDTFNYAGNYYGIGPIDGGSGFDSLTLNGDYNDFTGLNIKNVELVSLGTGHNYNLAVSDTGVQTTIDGSSLGATNHLIVDYGGPSGTKTVLGGAGDDTFVVSGGNDTFDGGAGVDTADLGHAGGGVTVDLSLTSVQHVGKDLGNVSLKNIEDVAGTDFSDTLTGNASDNLFVVGRGHDIVDGGAGNDAVSFQNLQLLSGAHGVNVDLRPGHETSSAVTVTSVEEIIGSQMDDTFRGDSSDNYFDAGGCITAAYDTVDYRTVTSAMTFTLTSDPNPAVVTSGGGQGVDTLVNFTRILAGSGDDIVYATIGGHMPFFDGGAGDDTISMERFTQSGRVASGLGTASVENVIGSAFHDYIGGDSRLVRAGAGDDAIYGGESANVMHGDDGADFIMGYAGGDHLYGDTGNDVIYGGGDFVQYNGNDKIYGGDGNDKLYAGGPNGGGNTGDVLFDGGAGNDLFYGVRGLNLDLRGSSTVTYQDATSGVIVDLSKTEKQVVGGGQGTDTFFNIDNLIGSAFGDTLAARAGDTVLHGGAGNDVLYLYGINDVGFVAGTDTADGGAGVDTASYANAWQAVTVSLAATGPQSVGGGGGAIDTLVSIENLVGTSFDDTLSGSGAVNVISPLSGNDAVSGLGGNDTIQLDGWFTAADTIDGGDGRDSLVLHGDYSAAVTLGASTLTNVEAIVFSAGFNYALTSSDETVASGKTLTLDASQLGSANTFTFDGSAETDGGFVVHGGRGSDGITLGLGADTIDGAGGNDLIVAGGTFRATDRISGGVGNDTLALNGVYNNLVLGANTLTAVETITVADGNSYKLTTNDNTVGAGSTLAVDAATLGSTFKLTFNGAAESDGKFLLGGGAGADVLTGGAGTDTLTGGLCADRLTGNGGADKFVYQSAAESTGTLYDTLVGFDFAADRIDAMHKVSAVDTAISFGALRLASFDADLAVAADATHLGVYHAVLFTPTAGALHGDTFLLIDANGVAGYQAGQDLVINLEGATNVAGIGMVNFV